MHLLGVRLCPRGRARRSGRAPIAWARRRRRRAIVGTPRPQSPAMSLEGHDLCPYLYRARNLVERFFNRIKHCRGPQRAMTSWRRTTSLSFRLLQSGYGRALMSPRPRLVPAGNRELFGGEQGDDSAPRIGDHHFFLNSGGGVPIGCRAISLESKDHSGLYLHRSFKRDKP